MLSGYLDDYGTVTSSASLCNLRKQIANNKGRSTMRMMENNTFFNVLTTIYKAENKLENIRIILSFIAFEEFGRWHTFYHKA